MIRLLTAIVLSALLIGAVPLTSSPTASAQQAVAVCVTLPPGEHTFSAPARDREGEVSFTVTVIQGGIVTGFIEPGGRDIPPAAMLDVFAGEDPYPLPEGVMIVDCAEAAAADPMGSLASDEICTNLDAGSHPETVSAGGRTYDIVINVDDRHVLESVEIRGQTYSASDALDLLAGFGASVPEGVEVFPCAFPPNGYPTTGSGGLAETSGSNGLWYAIAAVAALALGGLAVGRRSAAITAARRRDDEHHDEHQDERGG